EVEASFILGIDVGPNPVDLESAATQIASLGAPGRVVLHSSRGAVCLEPDGTLIRRPALDVPEDFVKGSTGAGDAFTAGFLHGVHEDCDGAECLLLATCVAAASLADPSASRGVLPLSDCLSLAARFGFRDF
ncbi:MAG: carbohydrate kinase family protein, partial [Pirellulales bacterium]|nr:carbohydrate kinase family protein [Pirellulales bacterium]